MGIADRPYHLTLAAAGRLLFVLTGYFLWQWLQRDDLEGTPLAMTHGHFDPFDLLAYTVGLLVTYVGEVLWARRASATHGGDSCIGIEFNAARRGMGW